MTIYRAVSRGRLLLAALLLAGLLAACGATPNAAPPDDAPEGVTPTSPGDAASVPNQLPPTGADLEFSTDFSRSSISYDEILSGGPPKDGIPAIDEPGFVPVAEADAWLAPNEPVVSVVVDGVARAYPIQILTWHELVNDTLNGLPLTVSFCPLCNTAIVFERTVSGPDGQALVLDFGTTGRLRFSNLLMYDRQTETWWQQATGEALIGELTGARLPFYPAEMIAWQDFQQQYPDADVLSRDSGFARNYGANPYVGYDDVHSSPFLYDGPPTPDAMPATARVLTLELGDEAVAYPYEIMNVAGVANDTVGDTAVVVFWEPGTASALDTALIADGRDVGAANAYARTLAGQTLTFEQIDAGSFRDIQTGSIWNARGQALAGELAGAALAPLAGINHLWFSWAAFRPETRIFEAQESGALRVNPLPAPH